MHELSLAQNLVDQVLAEAKEGRRTVVALEVGVGELMQVDRRAFREALKILAEVPELKGASISVRTEKARFVCNRCGNGWGMREALDQLEATPEWLLVKEPEDRASPLHFMPYLYSAFVRCPECGTADIRATSGKEIVIRRLVLT